MNRNEFFQALPITKLHLRLTHATLEICTDDIEDVHVMASGSQGEVDALRISAAADALNIEQPLGKKSPGAWLQIVIRLPRSWKGAITARTISGWMNLRSLTGTDLSLTTLSGAILANEMHFITVTARALTGDVKLSQAVCDKCCLLGVTGLLSALDVQLKQARAATLTSTVQLSLSAPFEALALASLTGDVCVDAPVILCNGALRSASGRLHAEGVSIVDSGPKVRAITLTSDLDITSTIE